jgi:hypothetical protein
MARWGPSLTPMPRTPLTIGGVAVAVVASTLLIAGQAHAEPGFASVQVVPRVLATTATQNAPYAAIACPTTNSCTAVGPGGFLLDTAVQVAGRPTVISETDGAWTSRSPLPLPAGASSQAAKGSSVSAVSCFAPDDCSAVGGYATPGGFIRTLVETETSGIWTPSSVPLPGNANEEGTFTSLWCASQGNCVALGFYGGGNATSIGDMVATESSGSWSPAVTLPRSSSPAVVLPVSIACASSSVCTAVGVGLVRGNVERTYAWSESAGTWSRPAALPSPRGLDLVGLSLACPSATTCLLAGELIGARGTDPVVSTETAGSWSRPHRIAFPHLTPATNGGTLDSIACASGTCEAVGSFTRSDRKGDEGAAVTWIGGTWSSVGLVHGVVSDNRAAAHSLLSAVACADPTTCVAIGAGSLTIDRRPLSDAFAATLVPVRSVGVPDAPLGVIGMPRLDGATISWLAPIDDGGAAINSYTATVEPRGLKCSTRATSCTVTGLRNGHTYRVSVTASNGTSASSASVRARFVAGIAPTVPRGVRITPSGTTAIVTWHASTAPRGEHVERYVVRATSGAELRGCATRALRCRVGSLRKGRTYVFTVVAQDASGTSARSEVRVVI